MKVMRTITIENPAKFNICDCIMVELPGETHTATAIQDGGDGMLFTLDQFLNEARPMNENGGTEGGYDASDMRKFLQGLSEKFPAELRELMTPFENGDKLRLLTLPEVCGVDGDFNECEGQIPYFKDRRNRIAERKGDNYEWMWAATVVSGAYFAYVNRNGIANHDSASLSLGVRPVFKLRNKKL